MSVHFRAGKNIAIKIPPHEYDATVRFYRDVIQLKELTPDGSDETLRFEFGGKVLWLDCVPTCTHAETWLEIVTENIPAAAEYLAGTGVTRCDAVEPLPAGFNGFWVASPCNIIHLVTDSDAT